MKFWTCLLIIFGVYLSLAHAGRRTTFEDRQNVHIVPSGSKISRTEKGVNVAELGNGKDHFFPASPSRHQKRNVNPGLVTSIWGTGTAYSYFSSYWFVPPKPTNVGGQVLYFYNGLENSAETEILQATLQWNKGLANQWSVAVWYGYNSSSGYDYISSAAVVPVNPGDLINGWIYKNSSIWTVAIYQNYAQVANIAVSFSTVSTTLDYAYYGIEAYSVTNCNQFPPSNYLTFSYNDLQDSGKTVTNPGFGAWTYPSATNCTVGTLISTNTPNSTTYTNQTPILTWSS